MNVTHEARRSRAQPAISPAAPEPPAPAHIDWFTTRIWPDGTQTVHIRPTPSNTHDQTIELNHPESQLLMKTLDHLAESRIIPWSEARQAVLRAFWEILNDR